VGQKLNGTYQLLAYADHVNLLGDNIVTIKKNTETLTDASKEVGLEINVEITKYILKEISSHLACTCQFTPLLLHAQTHIGQYRNLLPE
jgi:hypothetical protein